MPELPEVETVCRGLSKSILGAQFSHVEARRADLRQPLPLDLNKKLKGHTIEAIQRRAKYILIQISSDMTLILHLGMSGRLLIDHTHVKPAKHDHLIFTFSNGLTLRFHDPRRFGLCDLTETSRLQDHPWLQHLGIEPLDDKMSAGFLAEKFKGRSAAVKTIILDQRILVGVGNIYASESLYEACIHPARPAGSLTKKELEKLAMAIPKVLRAAIKAGGSSLRDYVQTNGELGYFQHQWAVYDRAGQACRDCDCDFKKTGGVQAIKQGGRSTYFCAKRQK